MTKILVIESSAFPKEISATRQIVAELVERLRAKSPSVRILRRDLALDPVPHAGRALLIGVGKTPDERSAEERAAVEASDALIDEVFDADVIVIGAPMYNFSIPSTLNSWIDSIAIAGRTFRYGSDGRPEGLLRGKKVFIVASRGGVYSDGPLAAFNFQDTYLRAVFGLLGLVDVEVVLAERQKMGPEQRLIGLGEAERRIDQLASRPLV